MLDKKIKRIFGTRELRESIWADKTLSGSRITTWIKDPHNYFEKVDLSAIEEKLNWGTDLEKIIYDKFIEKQENAIDLSVYWDVKNKIFQKTDKTYCYANIDGVFENEYFCSLVEVKNSTIDDLEELKKRYWYQMLYYSWFFKINVVHLVVLINGCKLRYKEIVFEKNDWIFMEKMVNNFEYYINNNVIVDFSKELEHYESIALPKLEVASYLAEHEEDIKWYFENEKKIKAFEKIKKNINDNNCFDFIESKYFNIKKSITEKSLVLDPKLVLEKFSSDELKDCFREKKEVVRFLWKRNHG